MPSQVLIDPLQRLPVGGADLLGQYRAEGLHGKLHSHIGVKEHMGVHIRQDHDGGVLGQRGAGLIREACP